MAHRYHFNKVTGRANICRAEKQCPLGEGTPHFDNKEDAKNYVEAEAAQSHEQFATISKSVKAENSQGKNTNSALSSLAQRLRAEAPINIDMELSQLYNEYASLAKKIARNKANIEYYEKLKEEGQLLGKDGLSEMHNSMSDMMKDAKELENKMDVYNREFDRRGGWNRAFIVNNINGHVHKSMNCSTCYSDTEYSWIPEVSDKSEGKIVEAAGNKACTVCYPSAPVSALNRPSKLMSEAEKIKAAERDDRDAKRVEKENKAKTGAITAPDGSPLVYIDEYGYETYYKNERSAQIDAVEAIVDKLSYDVMQKNDPDYWTDHLVERNKGNRQAKIDVLVDALAAKRGTSSEEVYADLGAKAEKKVKKWMKDNNLS